MRFICTLISVGAAGLLSACSEPAESQPKTASVAAAADIVVDFRGGPEAVLRDTLAPPANLIEQVFGSPAPADVQVASHVAGRFTSADRAQTIALLTRGGPLAGQVNAKPSMIVLLEQGKVVSQFVPPDVVYHTIAAVFDADGDALDDLVLSAQSYQMGQTAMRADVIGLAGGQRNVLMSLGTVYENTCDVPVGDKAVRAMLVQRQVGGELEQAMMVASCSADGSLPARAAFRTLAP